MLYFMMLNNFRFITQESFLKNIFLNIFHNRFIAYIQDMQHTLQAIIPKFEHYF